MAHGATRRITTADHWQARDLFTEGSGVLRVGVSKFNSKWESAGNALDEVEIEDRINCNLADLYTEQDLDQWAQENKLDKLFQLAVPAEV